jgi:hypothetical protein
MKDIGYQKGYISNHGVSYAGILTKELKKSSNSLKPIFEAITNSLEAIKDKAKSNQLSVSDFKIAISLYKENKEDRTTPVFSKLVVYDNGTGITEKDFIRLNRYKDISKGYNNRGSGRFQYLYHFNKTDFKTKFIQNNQASFAHFTLSKSSQYLVNNAISYLHDIKPLEGNHESYTEVTFREPVISESQFDSLTLYSIHEAIIKQYTSYFVENSKDIPTIHLQEYENSTLINTLNLTTKDIPPKLRTCSVNIPYISYNENTVNITDEFETFSVSSFKIDSSKLKTNIILLISKGETVSKPKLKLANIPAGTEFDGNRFMFMVSSPYIDKFDSDDRGVMEFPNKDSQNTLHGNHITIDDISDRINKHIVDEYEDFKIAKKEHSIKLEKLKEIFLLNEEDLEGVEIGDSEDKIIDKAYKSEAKRHAEFDYNMKKSIDSLSELDPTENEYWDKLEKQTSEFNQKIPILNKQALSHYISRRQLIIELFSKALDNRLTVQSKSKRSFNERILHNIIFKENSNDTSNNDIWLLSEDYMYFNGASNISIKNIQYQGYNIIRNDNLTNEESEYLTDQDSSTLGRKPDILLFPSEGKCIIIELKAPEVDVSKHLSQINLYASMIYNFQKEGYNINKFYGYLIGESWNNYEVRNHDGNFRDSPATGTMIRPNHIIAGMFGKQKGVDATLYTEVIRYSELIKVTVNRNKIFRDKLFGTD